jgi:serine/threonine-protein kinase
VTLQPCARCGRDHPPGPCTPPGGSDTRQLLPLPFDLLAGARVGEYQVTGLLGQGGMGVVYSGIHPLLGRKVAIKVLSQQMARRTEATARFLQEARAASTLHHQNIVDVFAFGELGDGRYYQVMELLEGESLRSILNRRGPLSRRQARTIIAGVLSGLGAAHRRGVVHRDIKPDNVFICGPLDGPLAPGDIKILDFGLAKRESGADISIKTRTGVTMGTPAYMSPEQCRGIAAIDARTDIYAAGVLLFEMIAGRTPFQSESAFDLMVMQINVKPPRLARLTGRAEPLEAVIMKALEKRPDGRYGTATDMLAAVDAAVPPGAPTEELPSLPPEEAAPPRARDFAERATLVAAEMATTTKGRAASGLAARLGGRRGIVQIAAGVTVAVAIVTVSALLARSRGKPAPVAPPRAVAPAASRPVVAVPAVLRARAAAPPAAAPAVVPAAAVEPARPRPEAKTAPAPAAVRPARTKKSAPPAAPRRTDDLDSPLDPYAR